MGHKRYAKVEWTAEDVRTLRGDLADTQAEEFLRRNEKHIRDPLIEHGWEVIGTLLELDDELPPKESEE